LLYFLCENFEGKSFVVKILQEILERLSKTSRVAVTAPTGVAACNIGGLTIHSWSGVGTGEDSIEELCAKVSRNREAKKNWTKTDILIIDEISMLSMELFDKLNVLGKRMRQSDLHFGGLQV
jgi:ATP-dependent DNA helicase PIF1